MGNRVLIFSKSEKKHYEMRIEWRTHKRTHKPQQLRTKSEKTTKRSQRNHDFVEQTCHRLPIFIANKEITAEVVPPMSMAVIRNGSSGTIETTTRTTSANTTTVSSKKKAPVQQHLPVDIEDEVSWVVHEFRQQGSPIHSIERNKSVNSRTIHATTKRKKALHPGYFSDVQYYHSGFAAVVSGETRKRQRRSSSSSSNSSDSPGPFLEVSYLFDKVLSLKFHVHIRILDSRDSDGGRNNKQDNDDLFFDENHKTSYTTHVVVACAEDDNDAGGSIISRSLATKEQWEILRGRLGSICDALNGNHRDEKTKSSSSSPSSLYAVLSKLLMSLNQLQTEVLENDPNNHDDHQSGSNARSSLLRPMTDREKSSHLRGILPNSISPSATAPGGVDLAILLVRCAAVGKHREIFSHPFPRASSCSSSSSSIAERIWKATECHQRFQRRRCRHNRGDAEKEKNNSPPDSSTRRQSSNNASMAQTQENSSNHQDAISKSPMLLHPSEQELLGFICSLPWMKRGRIAVTRNKQGLSEKDSTHIRGDGRRILVEVCLHIDGSTSSGGDEHQSESDVSHSPRFARSCQKYGGLTVYHGTHMESAWSILHNGFFNASEIGRGRFVKNGAMLGSGIYLTTSQKVATFFATSNAPTKTIRTALKHDSIRNLIAMAGGDWEPDPDAKGGVTNGAIAMDNHDGASASAVSFDDLYEVSCFPVFEARIVRPPQNEVDPSVVPTSRQQQQNNAKNDNKNCSDIMTKRDGKYYVVPDGRDVRITKLHLTLELTRKKRGTTNYFVLPEFVATRLLLVRDGVGGPSITLAFLGMIVSFALLWHTAGGAII